MNHTSRIIKVLVLGPLLLITALHGNAQVTDDHGNTCSTATPVAVPGSATGSLEIGDDADYFQISLTDGVTLIASATTQFDSVGLVRDANCNIIAFDDDSNGNLDFRIEQFLGPGTYYLAVVGFDSSDVGSYTVSLTLGAPPAADDHGNLCSTATSSTVPGSVSGQLETQADVDYFRISLTADATLTAAATSVFDSVGHLFDSSCTPVAFDDDSNGNLDFRIDQLLVPGTYYLAVVGFDSSDVGSYTVDLSMTPISALPPSVNDGGIVNNASYTLTASPIAPGTIVAIFGSNLTDGSTVLSPDVIDNRLTTALAGAQVTVDGVPVPLFYATPFQLGVQIPTELTGVASAQIQVTVGGESSTPRTIFFDPVSPGIFTTTQDGSGAGAIQHADGSNVTAASPAQPNEVIVVYATGLGQMNPLLATGVLPGTTGLGPYRSVAPVTATIDGLPATVEFSGMAPCCVGLNQINVRVPASAGTGNDVSLVIASGVRQSNIVTIPVAP